MLYDQVNPGTAAFELERIKDAFQFFLSIRFKYYMKATTAFHFLIMRREMSLTVTLKKFRSICYDAIQLAFPNKIGTAQFFIFTDCKVLGSGKREYKK